MNFRKLLAIAGLAAAMLAPSTLAHAAEPLAAGTYFLTISDEVSVILDVDDAGQAVVDAPFGVQVLLQYDAENRVLDEFDILLDGATLEVDIDAEDDGTYTYAMEAPSAADVDDDDDAVDQAVVAEEDADSVDDESAPGQHGRDNARENGGNANGYGAEGTKEEKDAAKAEDKAARNEAKASRDAEPSTEDADSVDEESVDEESVDEESVDEASAEDEESVDEGSVENEDSVDEDHGGKVKSRGNSGR